MINSHVNKAPNSGSVAPAGESEPKATNVKQFVIPPSNHRGRWLDELPMLDDLAALGWTVDSVYDLVNTSTPYPEALPVLVRHLQRGGYPNRVMAGIGRALAVKPAVRYWPTLVNSYLNARCPGEREGAGVALAACVTKEHFDDLHRLLLTEIDDPGQIRVLFLSALVRVDRKEGWSVVESVVDHWLLGKRAKLMLDRRSKQRT